MPASGALLAQWRTLVVLLLALAYAFSLMDRQILTILQEQIKAEFHLSDLELGALHGLTFGIVYSLLSVPVALLADRISRVRVIALSVALWSVATALCGLAANYAQLLLARGTVAIGEAGGTPSSHSIIADLYGRHERSKGIALFAVGTPVGIALGLLVGGFVGHAHGWRAAFIAVGLPGLLLALAVRLLVREPRRGLADGGTHALPDGSWSAALKAAVASPATRAFIAFHAVATMSGHAIITWLPSLQIRVLGLPQTHVAMTTAAMIVGASLPGLLLGGVVTDAVARRTGDRGAQAKLPAIFLALSVPIELAAIWAGSPIVSLPLFFVAIFLFQLAYSPVLALIQTSVAPAYRATAAAVSLFLTTLIGVGLGPLLVGFVSDWAQPSLGVDALRLGMTVTALTLVPAALIGARAVRLARDLPDPPRADDAL